MTLELSPPVATVSGPVEWLYETDTPTRVERDAPLSIPFTVPSSGTIAVIYKLRTTGGALAGRHRFIDVYRSDAPEAVASGSTSSHSDHSDDAAPYTLFAPVSEGAYYVQFSSTTSTMRFDVVSIRVGFSPT